MAISFSCRKCGKKLKAPDNAVGKTSKCPQCRSPVTCPEPVYEAEAIEPERPDVPEFLDDPYDDFDDGTPYGVDLGDAPLPSSEPRRPCPMCGEMILASAVKCRFCGEVFDKTIKQAGITKKKKKRRSSREDEELSSWDWSLIVGTFLTPFLAIVFKYAFLSFCIGMVVSIVYMAQGKSKGLKLFGSLLLAIVIWVAIVLIVGYVALQAQRNQQGMP